MCLACQTLIAVPPGTNIVVRNERAEVCMKRANKSDLSIDFDEMYRRVENSRQKEVLEFMFSPPEAALEKQELLKNREQLVAALRNIEVLSDSPVGALTEINRLAKAAILANDAVKIKE
jgi:hypothetical protein